MKETGLMMDYEMFMDFIMKNPLEALRGDVVGNDTFMKGKTHITLDTAFVGDVQAYETAVSFDEDQGIWCILYRTKNREDAEAQHRAYLKRLYAGENHFRSIQDGEIYGYEEEKDEG